MIRSRYVTRLLKLDSRIRTLATRIHEMQKKQDELSAQRTLLMGRLRGAAMTEYTTALREGRAE